MKKTLLIASIALLLSAPKVLANEINQDPSGTPESEQTELRPCPVIHISSGNTIEESHESVEAKIHEHEDFNTGCTPNPSSTPIASPTVTASPTPSGSNQPTSTPIVTSTPSASATPSSSPTVTASPIVTLETEGSVNLQGLIQQLINLLKGLLK